MTQGASSREIVRIAVLEILADFRKHKDRDLVKGIHAAPNTIRKYRDELIDEKLIMVEPGSREERFTPYYYVPEESRAEVEKLLLPHQISKGLMAMPNGFLKQLPGFLESLVKGEEFWVWLPDIEHPEKIVKYKSTTKTLQD